MATNPRFFALDGAFSVSYPAPESAYTVTKDPTGITADWNGGDGGTLRLFSEPARGRDARQVAKDLLRAKFPDSVTAYELPNAILGYQPGYGEVPTTGPRAPTTTPSICGSSWWSR